MLGFLTGAAPVDVPKGKGKGDATPAADATNTQVIQRIIPLLVNLDRESAALRDRSGFVVIVTNESFKETIAQARAQWRIIEDKRNETWKAANGHDVHQPVEKQSKRTNAMDLDGPSQASQAAAAGKPATSSAAPSVATKKPIHAMGGSFRGVLLKLMFELLHSKCPVQASHAGALTTLQNMPATDLDGMVHRVKPTHPSSKPGFSWVWCFMTSERCTLEFRNLLQDIMDARTEGLRIAPQHSQDGPIVKWLLQWQQTQRG